MNGSTSRRIGRSALVTVAVVAGACARAPQPTGRVVAPAVRSSASREQPTWVGRTSVRSFSELDGVSAVAELSGWVYAASGGHLWRFEPLARALPHPSGAPGTPIVALAAHPTQGLWAATADGLVARLGTDGWSVVAAPRVGVPTVLSVSAEGVWIGGDAGVARWKGDAWHRLPVDARVTALRPQTGGRLWVGTAGAGIYSLRGEAVTAHGRPGGQVLRQVEQITATDAGAILALGRDDRDAAALVLFDGRHWTSYRVPGPLGLEWVGRLGSEVYVCAAGQIFSLVTLRGRQIQAPPRNAIVLAASAAPRAPAGYPYPPLALDPVPVRLPRATVVADSGHGLFVGTSSLGVARILPRRLNWLRAATLTGGERRLKMGCAQRRCLLAVRGRGIVYDGRRFARWVAPGLPADVYIHAFVPGPGAKIWLLHGAAEDNNRLVMSELEGKNLRRLHELSLASTARPLRVRFAKFSPRGELWVGLMALQTTGHAVPWGVAVLKHGELVAHHRDTLAAGEQLSGASLRLPDDVRDVAFGGGVVTWVATGSGVWRLDGKKVTVYTENDGLESEITYSVGWSAKGEVLVGTLRGVGRFDGAYWRFDLGPALQQPTRVLLGEGQRLLAGTSAGLVGVEAGQTDVLTRAEGLVADGVLDLYRAPDGALWVLTEEGLSIVDD